jgi:aspartokinase/homoserine dehydrogenase 1
MEDVEKAVDAIRSELRPELERFELDPIGTVHPVTLLSLVAETMGQTPAVAGRFFQVLGTAGINIRAIAQGATGRSISCVIDAHDTRTAVRSVHSAFNFAHQEVSIFVMGRGVVGGELLEQIRAQQDLLVSDHDIQLNVVGLASSRHILFDEDGIELAGWNDELERAGSLDQPSSEVARDYFDRLSKLPVPILVDCTAADGMEELYKDAFAAGIHVVAANKKPLTVPWEQREELMESARAHHREYFYETSVGASLPVIDTLKNLVRTGDRVNLIEGSFSGTLGYLTNKVMDGEPLSKAVRTAKELGYTEPRPQDDLSGLDVARKALILARELQLPLTMDDVRVEPLVPENIINTDTLDEFFQALENYDAELEEKLEEYRASGKLLRYIARIDPNAEGEKLVVGPVAVASDHPAAGLRGSESFVAFSTARYAEYPLIVRGSGAGGAVTAAGVLADVLRISQALRGR